MRHGGFTGGGINVVTRSGSNRVAGTAFAFGRDRRLVGTLPGLVDVSRDTCRGLQRSPVGVSLGGPLVRNRVFSFSNVEVNRRATPSGFSVSGNAGQTWGNQATVRRALGVLETRYGLSAGDSINS